MGKRYEKEREEERESRRVGRGGRERCVIFRLVCLFKVSK